MARKICKPADGVTHRAVQIVRRRRVVVRQQPKTVQADKTHQRKAEKPLTPRRVQT